MSVKLMKIAVVVNIFIVAAVFYNLFIRTLGTGNPNIPGVSGYHIFRYFTIDSNLLMMVAAAIAAVSELMLVKGRINELPRWVVLLKFASTAAVALTMLVTAGFLAPNAKEGYFSMFRNENLFFHFLVPLVSVLVLEICERSFALSFREALWGLAPTLVYEVYYAVNVFAHAKNGVVSPDYDWYGFVTHGIQYAVVPMIALPAATFVILTLQWLGLSHSK